MVTQRHGIGRHAADMLYACHNSKKSPHRSVLLISECKSLDMLMSGILDAIDVKTVRTVAKSIDNQSVSESEPCGVIVDLDSEVDVAFDILQKISISKHSMNFIAATSYDTSQEQRARDCGADIYFENSMESITHIFCFFIATIDPPMALRKRSDRIVQISNFSRFKKY